jgi:hypothetical protein
VITGYLDVDDLATSGCTAFTCFLTTMAQGLEPQCSMVQLGISEPTERVVVGSFVTICRRTAPLELPRSSTGASALITRGDHA